MTQLTLPKNSPMLSKDFIYGVATASFQIEGSRISASPASGTLFAQPRGKSPIIRMVNVRVNMS